MKRVAVFVDAGYFWVQVGSVVGGSYTSRSRVSLRHADLHQCMLREITAQFPDCDLLRIYWYDGPGPTGKTGEHRAIDQLDDFKLRLGTRNGVGQQKGVDGLIIADLISLTQQKAITHALLVTGDADITPGVIAAQSMGLRVHLLSLGAAAATSPVLLAEVDQKRAWGATEINNFASTALAPTPSTSAGLQFPGTDAAALAAASVPGAAATPTPPLPTAAAAQKPAMNGQTTTAASGQVANQSPLIAALATHTIVPPTMASIAANALTQIRSGHNSALFTALPKGNTMLPREIDGELLSVGRIQLSRQLTDLEKRDLRREFRKLI